MEGRGREVASRAGSSHSLREGCDIERDAYQHLTDRRPRITTRLRLPFAHGSIRIACEVAQNAYCQAMRHDRDPQHFPPVTFAITYSLCSELARYGPLGGWLHGRAWRRRKGLVWYDLIPCSALHPGDHMRENLGSALGELRGGARLASVAMQKLKKIFPT